MFDVEDGKVKWSDLAWPDEKDVPIKGARGIYVLYRGATPIYIGKGSSIAGRIEDHAKDEFAPWWDNVCWYHCDDSVEDDTIKAIEALMIAHGTTIWNAQQPQRAFGEQYFLGDADDDRENRLWASAGEQSDVAE